MVEAKLEPGDDSTLRISPSFQATQSNMNRAHGGKLPKFYDIVMKRKGAELVYYTIHNEEGARFWKKSNWNVIVKLKNPYDKRIKGENYNMLLNHISHEVSEVYKDENKVVFKVVILDQNKKFFQFRWQVEKFLKSGPLQNCWLTTVVSRPIPLGSST